MNIFTPFVKGLLVIIVLIISVLHLQASSISVSGNISSNTTWSVDTVIVTGDITVDDTYTLTIDPGVVVYFMGHYTMNVQGALVAEGTAADSIWFTPSDTAVGWGGIRLENTPQTNDSTLISYCIIEHAKLDDEGGGLYLENVDNFRLTHSLLRYCSTDYWGGGIGVRYSDIRIAHNVFRNNQAVSAGAIWLAASNAVVENNLITQNRADRGGGLLITTAVHHSIIRNNHITFNTAVTEDGGGALFANADFYNNLIAGNHAGRNGGGLHHVEILPQAVSILNNTIVNNTCDGDGGGLHMANASSTIANCVIRGNIANGSGSSIYNASGISVINSNVEGGWSGAGNIDTTAMFTDPLSGDYSLQMNSPCINAGDTMGVPFYNPDLAGNARVVSCNIDLGAYEYHRDFMVGGNINTDTTWSSDTVFVYCDVDIADGATLTIDPGVVVYFMDHYTMNVQGAVVAEGTAADSIWFTPSDTAVGWGGIRLDNTPQTNDSTLISYCIIEHAENADDGGGMYLKYVDNFRLTHSLLRYCASEGFGGAIGFEYSDVLIAYNVFRKNRARSGGAIYIRLSTVILSYNLIDDNKVDYLGGGINVGAGSSIISNNRIINNTSGVGGGGIYNNGTSTLHNNLIAGNHSETHGGGCFYFAFDQGNMYNNTIVNNTCDNDGGGIYAHTNLDVDIANSVIRGNTANGSGSSIGGSTAGITVTNSNIEGGWSGSGNIDTTAMFADPLNGDYSLQMNSPCINAGDTTGVPFYNPDLAGNARLVSCNIDMGAYEFQGIAGGLISSDTTWSSDTVFVYCDVDIADGTTLTIDPGVVVMFMDSFYLKVQGALQAIGTASDSIRFEPYQDWWQGITFEAVLPGNDSSIVDHCVISKAKKDADGGGILSWGASRLRISNSDIHHCHAVHGGAIHVFQQDGIIIRNNTIRDNYANEGGGISLFDADVIITNNIISGNVTNYQGAGMFVRESDARISGNLIIGNSGQNGGAMALWGNEPSIVNNTMSGNLASDYGGALFIYNSSDPYIANCNIWGNTASQGTAVWLNDTGSDPEFEFCNIEGDSSSFAGPGAGSNYTGPYVDNLNVDPLFANTAIGDYRLSPASPVINAGTPDTTGLGLPLTDLDGNPRVYSCAIDMGAYESQSNLIVGGNITSDTTWASDTVFVHCDVDIDDGATLTIDPGVVVMFMDHYTVNVKGRILAQGSVADSIRFTVPDTAGYASGTHVGWGGIRFDDTPSTNDSSFISHCVLEYAGKTSLNGGGVYAYKFSKLKLSHSKIQFCQAQNGGGICFVESSPTVCNSIVMNNHAVDRVGGIYMTDYSNALLIDNEITHNTGANGGGIGYYWHSAPEIINNVIAENTATYSGGGLWAGSATGPALIHNNYFINNVADHGGGLLLVYVSPRMKNNVISNNYAQTTGGGVMMDLGWPLMVNNTISGNTAADSSGGGMFLKVNSYPELKNNIIWGNSAKADNGIGGDGTESPSIEYSNIEGGYSGTGNIDSDPMFVDTASGNYRLKPLSPSINSGTPNTTGLGLPLTDLDGNARVYSCAIDMGAYEAQSNLIVGGPITADTTWSSDTVYVHCDVDIADGATLTIDPGVVVMFMDAFGISVKGRILAQGAAADSIRFTVWDTSGYAQGAHAGWKGISFIDVNPITNDSSHVDYSVLEYGKGVSNPSGFKFGGALTIVRSSNITLAHSRISNCRADYGGGVYVQEASPMILYSSILNNTASSNGGGIYAQLSSHPTIEGCVIRGNTGNLGGGIFIQVSSHPTVKGCVIRSNTGNYGGGIGILEDSDPQIIDNHIHGNTAISSGGGIQIEDNCSPLISNNTVQENICPPYGAGISINTNSHPLVINNLLSGNAGGEGGAIEIFNSSNPILLNNLIVNNSASVDGAGILVYYGSSPEVYNNTIANNHALSSGGGVSVRNSSSAKLRNTLFWGNTAPVDPESSVEAGSSMDAQYSNFEFGFPGSGNISFDPLFADTASGDFRLLACSPMINAGDDTTGLGLPATDFYGQMRVKLDTVDIGAAEYNGNYVPMHLSVFDYQVCQDQVPMKISKSPAGGTLSGAAVSGGYFYPAFAGPGFHKISYTVDDSVACPKSDTITIEVLPLPAVIHAKLEVCEDKLFLSLSGGTPSGGSYSGPHVSGGAFDVQAAGVGTHSVDYTYTDPVTLCSRTVSFEVCVNPLPVLDFPDPADFCAQSGLHLLSASPAGGTFSGLHVTGNAFDADASGDGSFTVYYAYADSNGCVNTDSATITVLPQPTISLSGDTTICEGECVPLQAGGGNSYSWSTGYNFGSFNACPQQTTTYTVTVTGANGCTASDDVTITVNPLPNVNIMGDDTICPGDTAFLHALFGKPHVGSWSNGASGTSTSVSPSTTTTYTLTVTNLNTGCSATDQFTVVVRDAPVAMATYADTVCPGECTDLTAMGGVSYAWSTGGSGAVETVCPDIPASYTVTVTDARGCTAEAIVEVPVHPAIQAEAGPDKTICQGETAILTASGGVSYTWLGNPFVDNQTIAAQPTAVQTYYVEVTDANGCTAIDSVTVFVNDSVSLSLNGPDTIQPGDTAQLSGMASAGLPPYTYSWAAADFIMSSSGANLSAIPVVSEDYTLEVTDANGCMNSRTHRVVVDHPGAVAAGRIYYDNLLQTPMSGVMVHIQDSINAMPFDSTVTNDQGYFWFNGLDTATYSVKPLLEGRWGWGGVNSTDAQLVAMHFAQLVNLSGISLNVGDVNGVGSVNSTDAFLISKRFAGLDNSFPAGDWYFFYYAIDATGEGMIWPNIPTRTYGDVNGSYYPTMKASPKVWMGEQGVISAEEYRSNGLPVLSDEVLEPGAVSLVLQTELVSYVRDIRLPETASGELLWSAKGEELRISWFSLDPMQLLPGDALFYLEFDEMAEPMLERASISVTDNSELSDASGTPYSFTDLYLPKVYGLNPAEAAVAVYPNPASDVLYVEFENPEAQMVEARLYDVTGRQARTVHSGMLSGGETRWQVDLGGSPAGSYQLSIVTAEERLTKKVVVIAD